MPHPPGTIITLRGELARYTTFETCFTRLMLHVQHSIAPGSQWVPGEGQWLGVSINQCIRHLRPEDDWLCIWADDHEFEPDILDRLLSRQVDIVAPLVCLRSPPFKYSLFHNPAPGQYVGQKHHELDYQTGLVPVDTMGGPGCVIRRRVLDALGQPFFRCDPLSIESPKEDLYSFSRMREAGFQPYVDTDIWIGHCGVGSVTPCRMDDGRYGVTFKFQGMVIGSFVIEELPALPDDFVEREYHAVT